MDIAFATLNYNRICYLYSGINRGVNKKEGAILGYFDVRYVDSTITYRAQVFL